MREEESCTSTGIRPNSAAWLCYLGWWITGLIFSVMEKENKFVRLHALQSTIVFSLFSIVLIFSLVLLSYIPFFKVVFYIFGALAFIL